MVIALQGVVHETVGAKLFPYGPELFGGALGWHAFGLAIVLVGFALGWEAWRGTWRGVLPLALATAGVAAAVFTLAWVRFGDLHPFALAGGLSALGVAISARLRRPRPDDAP